MKLDLFFWSIGDIDISPEYHYKTISGVLQKLKSAPTVLRQEKEESRRKQSRLSQTTKLYILQNQSLHNVAQARCCLKQLQCLATRLPSGILHRCRLLLLLTINTEETVNLADKKKEEKPFKVQLDVTVLSA